MKRLSKSQLKSATRRLLQEIADRQSHNICWWLPELFETLCDLYGVTRDKSVHLPPEREFQAGCNIFRRELYVSKVSVFVEAVDGFHYQNPVVYGNDWFLCFDDEELPEIVIKQFKRTSPASAKKRAIKVMREAGIKFKMGTERPSQCGRVFPPKWDKISDAVSFYLEITAPIPIPGIHEAKVNSPSGECVHYSWTMEFKTEDVAGPFLPNGFISTRLCAFVMGMKYYMIQRDKRVELAEALIKMLGPEFKEIALDPNRDLAMFTAKYGERIKLSK